MKKTRKDRGLSGGASDLSLALSRHPLWLFMSWQDLRQRYRRSILGPFWLTLSTGIQIGTLGVLWAVLFGQSIAQFLPYFAIGLVLWNLLSGVIIESCAGFSQFDFIIRQINLPFTAYLLRVLFRHIFIFLHNLVIVLVVLLVSGTELHWSVIAAVPGFVLLSLVALAISGPVAVFCTRFRDMPQIVTNLTNILYYVTPIMWQPASLHRMTWVYQWNPVYHLLEVVRAPLLGQLPSTLDWATAGGALALSSIAFLYCIGRYRHRIAYWI